MKPFRRCHECGSVLGFRNVCDNTDWNGVPCLGLNAEEAALQAVYRDFNSDTITVADLEARIESALQAPPRRLFPLIKEWG